MCRSRSERSRHPWPLRAAVKNLMFDPEPRSLPGDGEQFAIRVRLLLGSVDGPGEESFDLTVCSPEWLAAGAAREGLIDGRHHVIVNAETFDQADLRRWLHQRVSSVEAPTWHEVGEKLARLGYWDFEDYRA